MKISCAFPPVPDTPDHVVLAEELGYRSAWVYDTPALQLDCWMTLALAAVRTSRIRLGPGVFIPSLRHPLATASAIATLVGIVGEDRVIVGAGTGFTGRRAMGQKPLSWKHFPGMVADVRALLRGEVVEVDGAPVQMLHWPGQAVERPIDVRWILGVNGPKGHAAAAAAGCGIFTSRPLPDADYTGFDDVVLLGFGTILDPAESVDDAAVIERAGPGATVSYHALYDQARDRLSRVPNGDRFRAAVDELPAHTRHLEMHRGHLTELNAIDREVISGDALAMTALTCHADELPSRLDRLAGLGVTEVAFQPMGDIERELRTFAHAAGLR